VDEDGYFGERIAAGYDASTEEMGEPGAVDPAVSLLAGLAGDGRALELGIGTGRIALPLARRGVPVHGIDLSRAMVAELDLMAQLAGMRLRERWAGWTREPFTSDSEQHVSIWEKPAR
jgi:2-polyprenyl-3-methyl-5-hydroxy-6-metoxy-1,4-benzoquinol methylase